LSDNQLSEKTFTIDNMDDLMTLFGNFDQNIKVIDEELDVKTFVRGHDITLVGKKTQVDTAFRAVLKLLDMIKIDRHIGKSQVRYAIGMVLEGSEDLLNDLMSDIICTTYRGKYIKCKTLGQKRYVKTIAANDVTFGIGPAGTGKTYLAVAMAVAAFKNKEVNRIVITRPAVEAGENLGFLPGDLQTKVDPYLRPLYDALFDILGSEAYAKMVERTTIEVAPLAYMRGRTLDDAFIILDEAQNTTTEQMKMFLTRTGVNSKVVITGDITQIDLPRGKRSGLVEVIGILKGIKGIEFVYLSHKDVVRHKLVMEIIQAYDRYEKGKESLSNIEEKL